VDENLWKKVVNQIVGAVLGAEMYPLWLILFTLTDTEFQSITPADKARWGTSVETFLGNLEIAPDAVTGLRRDQLRARYKPQRNRWEPFGQNGEAIQDVADRLVTDINSTVVQKGVQYEWRDVSDDFWRRSEPDQAVHDAEIREYHLDAMQKGQAVIVIDPVAFYHPDGPQVFKDFSSALHSENAVALVIPPFATCNPRLQLHTMLKSAVRRDFGNYYLPPIPVQTFASCGIGILDEADMTRLVRGVVGRHVLTITKRNHSVFS
jgi:hypothetical protein